MEKEVKIRLSLIALFFCLATFLLIFLGSLIFEVVSRSPAKSLTEPFSTLQLFADY